MHDSSQCPICRGQPIRGSMTDDEFFALLDACRNEAAEKQARFQQRIADGQPWSYDMASGTLAIGNERFPMIPIGTHSPRYQTWLWAWANEDFPPAAQDASRPIQSLHAVTGFQVFLDPGIGASAEDAQDLAVLAIHQLDASAFFRVPSDDPLRPTLYLAVVEREAPRLEDLLRGVTDEDLHGEWQTGPAVGKEV